MITTYKILFLLLCLYASTLASAQYSVFNKQDHAYKFGSIDVMVDPDSVMRAIKIIEEEIKFDHE